MNQNSSFLASIPTVTKNLIIINIIVWIAEFVLPNSKLHLNLVEYLGLHYWEGDNFNPAQIITYMFLHDDSTITHLFFNMFSLFMFGPMLERILNSKRFLFYYMCCGIGAALVQELVWTFSWQQEFASMIASLNNVDYQQAYEAIESALAHGESIPYMNNMVTIGASGSVFGLLLAFAMFFPNLPLYIMFVPVPIKAKWMVIGYGLLELIFGVTNTMGSIAHFAHLGGMLFGFIIIMIWKKKGINSNGIF